jgi:hypothetical protein
MIYDIAWISFNLLLETECDMCDIFAISCFRTLLFAWNNVK